MKYILSIILLLIAGYSKAQMPKIGDVITNKDGSKGVVFWIQPDGREGWMVSLFDMNGGKGLPWGSLGTDIPDLDNSAGGAEQTTQTWHAYQDIAGYKNTKAIINHIGNGNTYAAQAIDLENGWYLPAAGQIRKLFSALADIEEVIIDNGGESLSKPFMYWTGSEYDKDNAWLFFFNYGFPSITAKNQKAKIRPIKTFQIKGIEYDTTLTYVWNNGTTEPFIKDTPPGTIQYTVTVTNPGGCSTVAQKQILVNSGTPVFIQETICPGETCTTYGFNKKEAGIYNTVLSGEGGCNISVTLDLKVNKADTLEYSTNICQGEVYSENNFTAWDAGTYIQSWGRSGLCDSVVILHLSVLPGYSQSIYDTVCPGSTYSKHGFSIKQAKHDTTAILHLQARTGCDSTMTLFLTVKPLNQKYSYENICWGSSYNKNGFHLSNIQKDTIVFQQIPATQGCDTISYLCLSIIPKRDTIVYDSVCTGDTYNKYGFSIASVTTNMVCIRDQQASSGCDSTIALHLTAIPPKQKYFYKNICRGSNYNENGFFASNIQKDTVMFHRIPTVTGCDTIAYAHLTVMPGADRVFHDRVCNGKTYNGHGFSTTPVTRDTICTQTLQTLWGCDSTITLYLNVSPSPVEIFSAQICRGSSYIGHGFKIPSASGDSIYTLHLSTTNGCDSTIVLNLTTYPVHNNTIEAKICRGEQYSDNGFNVAEPDTYTQHLFSKYGCDSTIVLKLSVVDYFNGNMTYSLEDCTNHSYLFSVTPTPQPDAYTFEWDLGDSTISAQTEGYHHYTDSGSYQISLKATAEYLCEKVLYSTLYVPYYPTHIEIFADRTEIDKGSSRVNLHTSALPGIAYEWNLGDGTILNGTTVAHTYKIETESRYNITLTGINPDNCKIENTLQLITIPEIPNTFSPNGDGMNDVFMKGCQLRIVNRNGVVIFEGNEGWDGTSDGKNTLEDTYFYEVRYLTSQAEKIKKGYITLIR